MGQLPSIFQFCPRFRQNLQLAFTPAHNEVLPSHEKREGLHRFASSWVALELAFHVGICLGFFSVTAEDLLQVEAKGDDVQNKPG